VVIGAAKIDSADEPANAVPIENQGIDRLHQPKAQPLAEAADRPKRTRRKRR
jgi:hypothetical protein